MEKEQLSDAIHDAIFSKNIRHYKEVKDFYRDINHKDISKSDLNVFNELKEVFEWILAHPDYDFNALFDNYYLEHETYRYTNKELYNYFQVYYDDLLFTIEKYNKKEFIIRLKDLE